MGMRCLTPMLRTSDMDRTIATAEWGSEGMPNGMREFAIEDPDGYCLSFGEPLCRSRVMQTMTEGALRGGVSA
jgi:hypothetical protein